MRPDSASTFEDVVSFQPTTADMASLTSTFVRSLLSKPLNVEQDFLKALCSGHRLHPSIGIKRGRVADIACGDGTWLLDLSAHTPKHMREQYVGFGNKVDRIINDTETSGVRFVVHDPKNQFHRSWLNYFDVVNISLIAADLQVVDIAAVIKNAAIILKPGGHLQWREIDMTDISCSPPGLDLWKHVVAVLANHFVTFNRTTNLSTTMISALNLHHRHEDLSPTPPQAQTRPSTNAPSQHSGPGPGHRDAAHGPALRLTNFHTLSTSHHRSASVQTLKNDVLARMLKCALGRAVAETLARGMAKSAEGEAMDLLRRVDEGGFQDAVLDGKVMWVVARKVD